MAKKKKRATLPRVTVLAFNRRELAAFASAVEKLGLYVEDLRMILANRPQKKKPADAPPIPPAKDGAP